MQPFFLSVDDKFLAKQVLQAADRVFFSASGVSRALANAIVTAARTRPALQLVVVLDASPLPARMGLADTSGLEILHSAQPDLPNLSVQQSPGLRLCVMVTDARGWVWWPVVQAVEPPRVSQALPNAMGLRPDQVDYVLASFSADSQRLVSLPSADTEVSTPRPPPLPEDSGVPSEPLSSSAVRTRAEDLRLSPPENFHELRKISVYRPLLQYVEGADLEGVRAQAMNFSLPDEIASLPVPSEVAARLRTSLRLFDDGIVSSDALEHQLRKYKDFFCPSVKPPHGRLILKRDIHAFEATLRAFQDHELASFTRQFRESLSQQKSRLESLVCRVYATACQQQVREINDEKEACDWLRSRLGAALSDLPRRADRIRLTPPIYKDVTYSTLNDPRFVSNVRKVFPSEPWLRHELYESRMAAAATGSP